MKLNNGAKPQGSMGIPADMIENQRRFQQAKEAQEARAKAGPAGEDAPPPPPPEAPEQVNDSGFSSESEEMVAKTNPIKVLKDIGLDFNEDDLQSLLFRGFYEKEVEIVKGHFKAKIRTLTGAEYDEIDELLGEDMKTKEMTRDGFEARRSMWVISYGVTELAGKPICKPVKSKAGEIDTKETAKQKRKVIGALSSMLINRLIQVHGTITTAVSLIGQDPDLLKNS